MQCVSGIKSFNNHEVNCNYFVVIKIKVYEYNELVKKKNLSSILLLAANGSSQLHKMYQSRCTAKNS